MDWGGLVLLGVVAWLIVGLLIPRGGARNEPGRGSRSGPGEPRGEDAGEPQDTGAPTRAQHRVAHLCRELTGDPRRDRPLQNRILALGPGVVPLVVQEHAEFLRHPGRLRPAVLARFEETVADFGLAAVPTVTAHLARVNPTSTLALSLTRALVRLGPGGAAPTLRAGLANPQLAAHLPRWRLPGATRNVPGVLSQVLRDRPAAGRPEDLDVLAGLIATHPTVLTDLWNRGSADEAGRLALVSFQTAWLPLAQPALVRLALADPAPAVRLAAVRLADLIHNPELIGSIVERSAMDPEIAVRVAAVRALGRALAPETTEALQKAAEDPAPPVFIAARQALRGVSPKAALPAPFLAGAASSDESARGPLLLLAAASTGDVDALVAGLDAATPTERGLAAELLGEYVATDPRAKERLFRATEGRDLTLAARAALALARAGEVDAPELLARQVRDQIPPEILHLMQETAQVLGSLAAVPLARRLRNDVGARVETLLAVMRSVPYAVAVPPLLRALEATRGTRAEGQIAATLAVGGPEVRAALDAGLQQPGRGLLTPALAWLAAYGTPADLPILLTLLDQHPPLRGIILGLIEAQGEPAREALRARVQRGGDDAALAGIEERLAVLDACLGLHETA